jgi:hypothetical protein
MVTGCSLGEQLAIISDINSEKWNRIFFMILQIGGKIIKLSYAVKIV